MITFTYDKLKEKQLLKRLFSSGNAVEKAIGSALSDTTKQMRSHASKLIRETVRLSKKAVDRRLRRVYINSHHGGLMIRGTPKIGLHNFKPRQTKTGVMYQPHKGGKKIVIPSAFGPKITKLHGSVYVRNTKARKPISIKQYYSLAHEAKAIGAVVKIAKNGSELMRNNLRRRLNLMKLRAEGKVK